MNRPLRDGWWCIQWSRRELRTLLRRFRRCGCSTRPSGDAHQRRLHMQGALLEWWSHIFVDKTRDAPRCRARCRDGGRSGVFRNERFHSYTGVIDLLGVKSKERGLFPAHISYQLARRRSLMSVDRAYSRLHHRPRSAPATHASVCNWVQDRHVRERDDLDMEALARIKEVENAPNPGDGVS